MTTTDTVLETAREHFPAGTRVTYWPGVKQGPGIESKTRGEVWRMPGVWSNRPTGGQLVVAVEGYAGGIALTHVSTITPRANALTQLRAAYDDGLSIALQATDAEDLMTAVKAVLDTHDA